MSKPQMIGEMQVGRAILPVYASAVAVDRLLHVNRGYTGDDERSDKVGILLDEASATLRAGRTEFSHMVRDRAWAGDPDKIESERMNVSISIGLRSVTLGFAVRRILKMDPRFEKIAAAALVASNKYENRRDV